MDFLVTYATTDGLTGEIADRIGLRLMQSGHRATVSDLRDLPRDYSMSRFDGIIVGASLHPGYQRRVRRFVTRQIAALRSRPSAFFSVCLAVASKFPRERAEALAIPRRFVAELRWAPDAIEVIAGALRFSRYGFLRRRYMMAMARSELDEAIDPRRDYCFTDWSQVDAFAASFEQLAMMRAARAFSPEVGPAPL